MHGINVTVDNNKYIPTRATDGSHGYDLRAKIENDAEREYVYPGESQLIKTGVKMAIPRCVAGMVVPRSGLALKHGVTVCNAPGQIDSDYRGEIGVIVINHGKQAIVIEDGDRVAQIVFVPVMLPEFNVVESLDDTSRGDGGFGHSGVA